MEIPGYKYITHKLINRPWGPEVRYTVKNADDNFIDDVFNIPSMKIEEKVLVNLLLDRLKRIDVPPEPMPPDPRVQEIEQAVADKEAEIRVILEVKGLLTKGEAIADIKSKAEIVAVAVAAIEEPIGEVKP
jgi:hypothetical protein